MTFTEWEALIEADPDAASKKAAKTLDEDPENALALFIVATVHSRAERYGLASNLFKRITQLKPERSEAWNNLGMCYSGMGMNLRARECFQEAWKRGKSPAFAANLGMTYFSEREYKRAIEWCERALSMGDSVSAKSTLGMTYLALGEWEQAWKFNASSIGGKFRRDIQYQEEPRWKGEQGKTVVFYGEQGLGDEIMYASCIPDAAKDVNVILECDKRLEGLFRRSFPGITIHGTRNQQSVPWLNDMKIDARCPVGQLPEFYRRSPKDCPGTPYLQADPERRIQWRALLESFGARKKIGICWSGGSKHNKPKERNIGLETLRPLIESMDATWVSLQYKDPTEEIEATGLPVHHWKRACETEDYDDTAALVAELDMVIGVHTSAHHLAGALGVPGVVLVPSRTIWVYCLPDGSMTWYSSAKLFKQREKEPWSGTVKRLVADLAS